MNKQIIKYEVIERKLKPSDFVFGLLFLSTMIGIATLNLIVLGISAIAMFIVGTKAITNALDYDKKQIN